MTASGEDPSSSQADFWDTTALLSFSRRVFLVCVCLFFPFLPILISAVTQSRLNLGSVLATELVAITLLGVVSLWTQDWVIKAAILEHSAHVGICPIAHSAINVAEIMKENNKKSWRSWEGPRESNSSIPEGGRLDVAAGWG